MLMESELAKNGFTRAGYTSDCWVRCYSEDNKQIFKEGAMVSNLTAENNRTIVLYARWDKISSSDNSASD